MARALPRADGLQLISGLKTAKGIDIQFTPSLAIIAGRLDKLGLDIRSFKEPLRRSIKQVVIPSIRKNFASGGRPKWQALAPSTVDRKGSSKILEDTGALKRVMGQINIWTITRSYAIITDLPDNVWYGKVHQAGLGKTVAIKNVATKRAVANVAESGGIPARPFVLLQKSDERAIESVFRHWLDERIRANMGRL